MLGKIGGFFVDFGKKFLSAIPLLSNFISVKIAANDAPAIKEAVNQFRELCQYGLAFADLADEALADNKLTLEEMEAVAKKMKGLVDEAGDFVTSIKDAT